MVRTLTRSCATARTSAWSVFSTGWVAPAAPCTTTPEGPRTGAYLASRLARDVVERRMLDLLEPDWHLNGKSAARDLKRSVQQALRQRLDELKAPPSGLRSSLSARCRRRWRWLPCSAPSRVVPSGPVTSSGPGTLARTSSRPARARQLSTDDLRDPNDALANLRRDSVVSNAMSADTEFHVSYRRVELRAPFLVVCATDGCFGYLRTPMHFEHLVLSSWWRRDDRRVVVVVANRNCGCHGRRCRHVGDGVGADFKEFQ